MARRTKRKPKKKIKRSVSRPASNRTKKDYDMLKKEVIIGGFFTIAVGLIWLFATMGYFELSGIAGPFIIIIIGFLMAIAGARD